MEVNFTAEGDFSAFRKDYGFRDFSAFRKGYGFRNFSAFRKDYGFRDFDSPGGIFTDLLDKKP